MARYWPSLSGERRCACVGDDVSMRSDPAKNRACVDMFARRRWENSDGASAAVVEDLHANGDGFSENMTGPPATAGVYRFTNGAELFMATNHPLMNSRVFGLESLASALGIDLRTLDAVYLNPGNYEGFGALFCGGRIDPAVVARDGKASTSYIQRRLSIGYNRAATLIEQMEEQGVIGPADHAGRREIFVGDHATD